MDYVADYIRSVQVLKKRNVQEVLHQEKGSEYIKAYLYVQVYISR